MTARPIALALVAAALVLLAREASAQVSCPPVPAPVGAAFAPTPIPCLPNASTPNGTEVVPGYQNGREVKFTTAQLWAGFVVTGFAVRSVTSGTSDSASATDFLVKWTSPATGARSEGIPACASGNKGAGLVIKDGVGNAATYNITVTAAGSSTIDGQASYTLNTDRQALMLECDGAGDWTIL